MSLSLHRLLSSNTNNLYNSLASDKPVWHICRINLTHVNHAEGTKPHNWVRNRTGLVSNSSIVILVSGNENLKNNIDTVKA